MPEKIPATVVTGFLGAGKTSLIRHLVENAGGRRLALVINEFKSPVVTAIYVGSLLLIGMHLWHGISSALVTMGGYSPRYKKLVAFIGYGFTILIVGGFISIPVFIYSGVLGIQGPPTH